MTGWSEDAQYRHAMDVTYSVLGGHGGVDRVAIEEWQIILREAGYPNVGGPSDMGYPAWTEPRPEPERQPFKPIKRHPLLSRAP